MEQIIAFASEQFLLSSIWLVLVVIIIFISVKMKMSAVKQLSPQELTFLVNRENGVVVDIRAENEFKANHIVDAVHFSNEKVKANDFTSLEKYKDRPIIVLCASGLTANQAANSMLKAGFEQVNLLKGGIQAWITAGLPLTKK